MRAPGYDWSLSIWQLEVSLTQTFDRPLRGREFFEEVIRDNLDLGRPDRVQLILDRTPASDARQAEVRGKGGTDRTDSTSRPQIPPCCPRGQSTWTRTPTLKR